ncbi:MAG: FG-GAP-like repeat-containing protein [Elusimicrobia bacterium]|nr:FG-GAP-like repeat-containing protein [Elusimicrobiota bacterium]
MIKLKTTMILILLFTVSIAATRANATPAAISNLTGITYTSLEGSLTLRWTAPGSDGTAGTAAAYIIRCSDSANIEDEADFTAAYDLSHYSSAGLPDPVAGGNEQLFTSDDLIPGTTYYFAVKAETGTQKGSWSRDEPQNINHNNYAVSYDTVPRAPAYSSLYTDYVQEPYNDPINNEAGLENPSPLFTWTADAIAYQKACQVIVSTDSTDILNETGSTWDSGKVTKTNESLVYSGPESLQSSTKYRWRVRTWDVSGDTSPYSPDTFFTTNMFVERQAFNVGSKQMAFAAGDINSDGYNDFIRADWNMDTVTAYVNTTTGTFSKQWQIGLYAYSQAAALADVDSDGDLDLIILNSIGTNNVSDTYIYKNDGTGNFSLFKSLKDGNGGCYSIATADVDRDGDIDFIEGINGGDNILYKNDGNGDFEMTEITTALDDNTYDILLADLNNDTYPDLITGNYLEKNRVYLNDGSGNFNLHEETAEAEPTYAIALIDYEGDGDWDYLSANRTDLSNNYYKDRYYENDGNGNYTSFGQSPKADDSYALSVADINNDGLLDYVEGNAGSGEPNAYERTYLSDGDGTFTYTNISRSQPLTYKTLLFDFSGDSTVDMLRGVYDNPTKYLVHQTTNSNVPPAAAGSLTAFHDGTQLYLGWDHATDDHTSNLHLCYNVRIGTSSGNYKTVSGLLATDDNTGSFKGNIGRSTYVYLNVPSKTYFWQVQAIDTSKTAGAWSNEMVINTKPHGGWATDGIIPSTAVIQRGYSFSVTESPTEPSFSIENGLRGLTDIKIKVRDKESNNCYLTDFYYSTGSAVNWHSVTDTDNGLTAPGQPAQDSNWPDNGGSYFGASDQYGSGYYNFTWDSNDMDEIGVHDFESSSVSLKFKVKDVHLAISSYVVTDPFYIDNLKPTVPGPLKDSGVYLDNSYTLNFSTPTPATDINFREYKIFGRAGNSTVSQYFYDFVWDISDDSNLGYSAFNGASSTTVTGLTADTTYYFKLYAYDEYGNFNDTPEALSVKTNDPPEISFVSATQRKDGSGLVDIVFQGRDNDNEPSFYIWNELYYRDKPSNPDRIMTPALDDISFSSGPLSFTTTLSSYTFVWDAGLDVANYSKDTFIVNLKIDDGRNTGNTGYSGQFTIDTLPPVMGNISATNSTAKSMSWSWNAAEEDNFTRYRLWYSSNDAAYVINKDTSGAKYITIGNQTVTSTTTYNLKEITRYWACVWADDDYGYSTCSATGSYKTGFPPDNYFKGEPQLIRDGSGNVRVIYDVTDRDGNTCNTQIEYSLDESSWRQATVAISTSTFGNVSVNNTKEYQIRDILTYYDSNVITNTLTFNWLSKKDIDNVVENTVSMRITSMDDAISSVPDMSSSFKIDNSQPKYNINQWSLSEYNHSESLLKLNFIGEYSESEILLSTQTALSRIFIYDSKNNPTQSFNLAGETFSVTGDTALNINLNKSKRDTIARWDGAGKTPYFVLLSSATRDIYGNYSLATSSSGAVFDSNIDWIPDTVRPEITGATYTITGGDINLYLSFSENIDNIAFSTNIINGIVLKDTMTATSNFEPLDSSCEILTTTPNTDNLTIRIPYGKHNLIWSWNSESLYIAVSSQTIQDLSRNPIITISTTSSMPIHTSISTITPTITAKVPAPGSYDIARDTGIAVAFSDFLKPAVFDSLTVKQIENSEGKTVDYEISGSTSFNKQYSLLTFAPHENLPGNSIIRVSVDSDKIRNFADVPMAENIHWDFRTLISNDIPNFIVSKSGRITLEIPAGQFPANGRVEFNEGISPKNPKNLKESSSLSFESANDKESSWEDPYHYPIDSLTTEIIFYSTSGVYMPKIFDTPGTLTISYNDALIDDKPEYLSYLNNAPVKEKTLKVYYLDEEKKFWMPLNSKLNSSANTLSADLKHFSVYTVMGGPNYDTSGAHPFPVPYKPTDRPSDFKDNPLRAGITFTAMPSECAIEIYTIAGRLVNTLTHSDDAIASPGQPGNYYWYPVVNSQDNEISSGVYIYYLESEGTPKTGKLMIIR